MYVYAPTYIVLYISAYAFTNCMATVPPGTSEQSSLEDVDKHKDKYERKKGKEKRKKEGKEWKGRKRGKDGSPKTFCKTLCSVNMPPYRFPSKTRQAAFESFLR